MYDINNNDLFHIHNMIVVDRLELNLVLIILPIGKNMTISLYSSITRLIEGSDLKSEDICAIFTYRGSCQNYYILLNSAVGSILKNNSIII